MNEFDKEKLIEKDVKSIENRVRHAFNQGYEAGLKHGKEQEPKTGHWILADIQSEEDIDNDNYRYICSECQHSDIHAKDIEVPYCWNCGAKMEGEEKE